MKVHFNDRKVTNGRNTWHVTGEASEGIVLLHQVFGDITDPAGLKEAVRRFVAGKARFARAGVEVMP
jgi:hypothetical protein